MKKIIFSIVIFSVFLFVFLKSNTWQTKVIVEIKDGVEYKKTIHNLDWERFFNYLNDVPENIKQVLNKDKQ